MSAMMTGSTLPQLHVDMLVIGWGKGGKTFAAAMAGAGKKVAIVEQSPSMYGGTCINIACVPTKTLVHSADERRESDDPQAHFERAVQNRDDLIAKLNRVNLQMLADRDTVTIIDGRAHFVAAREVEVTPTQGGEGLAQHLRVSANTVVINTGAVTTRPPIPGADLSRVHDSTTIQHVKPLPQRLAIVGAGPIALEFASMFRGFGSAVTMLVRGPRLLSDEDDDVAAAVTEVLENAGITILAGMNTTEFQDHTSHVEVHFDGAPPLAADAVLCATGRRPATEGLRLEAAGVETDGRGAIVVDDQLLTTADGVYAMGDVHGGAQQTYLSLDDHRIVFDALAGLGRRRASDRVAVPSTIFMTPPLSSVGVTEEQALGSGSRIKTVCVDVDSVKAMPRPKTVGDARGVIKFVVDADTDLMLGARLFHVDSQEVINLIALAMRAGVTASELRDGIWTHPSSTEALNEVLGLLRE